MKSINSTHKFMLFFACYLILLPYIIAIFFKGFFLEIIDKGQCIIIANGASSFLMFFLPVIIYVKCIQKERIADVIPHKKLSLKSILVLLVMSIFIEPATSLFATFFSIFFENDVETYFDMLSDIPLWEKVFFIAVVPAVFEEFMFRGFIFTGLKKAKPWKIALVSGLYFGLMHMNLLQFTYAVPLGMLFAFIVYSCDSIFASMILHFLVNFYNVIFASLADSVPDSGSKQALTAYDKIEAAVMLFPVALICITILFFLVKYFVKINKSNSVAEKINAENNQPYNYITGDYLYHNSSYVSLENEPVFTVFFYINVVIFIIATIFY